jgi:hypothetical protein
MYMAMLIQKLIGCQPGPLGPAVQKPTVRTAHFGPVPGELLFQAGDSIQRLLTYLGALTQRRRRRSGEALKPQLQST